MIDDLSTGVTLPVPVARSGASGHDSVPHPGSRRDGAGADGGRRPDSRVPGVLFGRDPRPRDSRPGIFPTVGNLWIYLLRQRRNGQSTTWSPVPVDLSATGTTAGPADDRRRRARCQRQPGHRRQHVHLTVPVLVPDADVPARNRAHRPRRVSSCPGVGTGPYCIYPTNYTPAGQRPQRGQQPVGQPRPTRRLLLHNLRYAVAPSAPRPIPPRPSPSPPTEVAEPADHRPEPPPAIRPTPQSLTACAAPSCHLPHRRHRLSGRRHPERLVSTCRWQQPERGTNGARRAIWSSTGTRRAPARRTAPYQYSAADGMTKMTDGPLLHCLTIRMPVGPSSKPTGPTSARRPSSPSSASRSSSASSEARSWPP